MILWLDRGSICRIILGAIRKSVRKQSQEDTRKRIYILGLSAVRGKEKRESNSVNLSEWQSLNALSINATVWRCVHWALSKQSVRVVSYY